VEGQRQSKRTMRWLVAVVTAVAGLLASPGSVAAGATGTTVGPRSVATYDDTVVVGWPAPADGPAEHRTADRLAGSTGTTPSTRNNATKALPAGPGTGGTLRIAGNGFSSSEQRMAQLLYEQGNDVVLRQATGAGRTSDLLVNGVAYDVYTPTTGNVNAIVSAIAKKGSQVNGGGVVLDLSSSPLTPSQVGNLLPRVQGVTDQISNIIVVG
jgi:hypothetical protein